MYHISYQVLYNRVYKFRYTSILAKIWRKLYFIRQKIKIQRNFDQKAENRHSVMKHVRGQKVHFEDIIKCFYVFYHVQPVLVFLVYFSS